MRRFILLLAGLLCGLAAPAAGREATIESAAGTAGRAAIAIARQTGTSIVIADGELARRKVPAIRGRMEAGTAVRRLASLIGGEAVAAGLNGWRIVAASAREPPGRGGAPARRPAQAVSPVVPPPPPPPPAEIVVLGSKRQLPLEDFAGNVAIIDGSELQFGGVGGTEKVAQMLPSISSTHLGSGRNKLFIRGIADSSFTGPTQATVGQYLGDLRLTYNAPDPDLRLSDIERVEVLEGPQGTLYGAGSLGGIIRLVPNAPELGVTDGSAQIGGSLTWHGAAGADGNATVNLPLAEDAALRFTVDAASQGGYIDKPLLGLDNVNRSEILGGRATIRVELSPDWTVDLMGVRQTNDAADSQYADRNGPPLQRSALVVEGSDADYAQTQLVVSGWLGDLRLRSTTGASWQQLEERYDATMPDGPPTLFTQSNDNAMIANETRLWRPLEDRLGWLVGLSFIHNETELSRQLENEDAVLSTTGVRNVIDEATLYGEASYRLREGLIVTGGGRLTHSRLGGEGMDVAPMLAALLADVTAKRGETVFLPSAALLAQLGGDTSLFLRYQEGFRPGGLAIEGPFVRRFDNDHTGTLELGLRHGYPRRGPFDLAASVSYTRWTDIQADFIDGEGLPSTANIGDGRIWSVNLSAGAELAPGLRIEAGAVYNKGKVDDPDPFALARNTSLEDLPPEFAADGPDNPFSALLRLTQVPNIARFSGRLGFDYSAPIGDDLELTAKGWASYIGKSRLGVGPELGELQGDYLDSGLTVRIGTPARGLSLGVTNLLDVEGNRFALGTPFAVEREQVTPLRPRTIRLGFDAAF